MMFKSALFSLLIFITPLAIAAEVEDYSSTIEVFKSSPEAAQYFDKAYGFALFPTVGKGGLGIGAAHGKGQVYQGGKVTGKTALTHISIGFQAGGQAFSEIIFFEDKRAYEEFIHGNFEFDAKVSAVAITAGAQAQAGTAGTSAGASSGPKSGVQAPAKYNKGMAIFTHAKGGLMYEAAIGGQKFSFEPI